MFLLSHNCHLLRQRHQRRELRLHQAMLALGHLINGGIDILLVVAEVALAEAVDGPF